MAIEINNLSSEPDYNGLPVIKVFGVGGGGGNVVNRMIEDGVKGVQYIAANTDMMVLKTSGADVKIPLGSSITKGLGAGMNPDVGRLSAEEDVETIKSVLENTDMVFVAAGMGGGTGTGAAPVIAEIAKEKKILTVGVVTTPFRFEGNKRFRIAEKGVEELKKHVDTLMVIPNNKLLEIASQKTTMTEAFDLADDVLKQAISGITNLVNLEGLINLDFADLRTVMSDKGRAIMGTGIGKGENRGVDAARKAIDSPLLSDTPISGATGVIINIVADEKFSLLDAEAAADYIQQTADQDADVIFGLVTDTSKQDEVIITVIATGFEAPEDTPKVSRHQPLRVQDSLRNKRNESQEDEEDAEEAAPEAPLANSEVAASEPALEDEIVELDPDTIGLKKVENTLYHPDKQAQDEENENRQKKEEDYHIPSFMRKSRL